MDLESTMLNEISQIETNTVSYHLHVESKIQQTTEYNNKKHTYSYREQISGYQWDEGRRRDSGVSD